MRENKVQRNHITFPLYLTLIFPFVAMIVFTAGVVGYISITNGKRSVDEAVRKLGHEMGARIQEHLMDFLRVPHEITELNAKAMETGFLDAGDPESLQRWFWQQIQTYDKVTSIYFGNTRGGLALGGREGPAGQLYVISTDGFEKGTFRKYRTDPVGNPVEQIIAIDNFDARTRPWYRRAVEQTRPVWSDIYILFTGQDMAIAAARPVFSGSGNLLGVISIDIFLSHISGFLHQLKIGKTGIGFIIDESGFLVASSTGDRLFTDIDGNGKRVRIKAKDCPNPIISQAMKFIQQHFDTPSNQQTESFFQTTFQGQSYYIQILPVRDPYGIHWQTIVVFPESDFMDRIYNNYQITIFLILLAAMIAMGVGIFMTIGIVSPMNWLLTQSENLARENWSYIDKHYRIREFNELISAFNRMGDQLQSIMNHLRSEITKRKKVENTLRESEKKYRELVENANSVIIRMDRHGRILFFNDYAQQLFGYTEDEIIGRNALTTIVPETDAKGDDLRQMFSELCLHPDQYSTIEYENRCRDGRSVWISWTNKAIYDQRSCQYQILSVGIDITKRKEAEWELEKREQLQRTIFNAADNISFIITDATDPDPLILEFSPGAEKIFGYRREEIIGRPVSILHLPEDMAKFPEAHEKMRQGKESFRGEATLIRKSGEKFPALFTTYPLKDAHGHMYAALGVSIDISERKQLEMALQQAHKMEAVGTLAGGIAHDFNNILGVIMGNSELAAMELSGDHPARGFVHEITKASLRARDVIRQLLGFTRQNVANIGPIRVTSIIQEALSFLRSSIPANIDIRFFPEAEMDVIQGDATQISQMLINLSVNAFHEMKNTGGILEIRLTNVAIGPDRLDEKDLQPGPYLRISVRDTGKGIDPQIQPRIFDPYFTTKEVGEGSGMGLAIVHGIVSRHNGHISVESVRSQGTVFHIYFPTLDTALETVVLSSNGQDEPLGNARILFVDDESDIVSFQTLSLTRMGLEAEGFTNAQEALDAFQASPNGFDLIITDMTMPGMSGIELAQRIRQIRPDIPIILCTGRMDGKSGITPDHAEITAIGVKPMTRSDMKKLIQKALAATNPVTSNRIHEPVGKGVDT